MWTSLGQFSIGQEKIGGSKETLVAAVNAAGTSAQAVADFLKKKK
jgi:hypothetical protein